jgi:hypothetical protein
MKVRSLSVLAAGVGTLLAGVSLDAHHSFEAEYDRNQPLEITGTVTLVEWTNPHARIYVDAPDPDDPNGEIVHWDLELGPPNGLMRRGWNRNSLRPGHVVTVSGFRSRTVSNIANARTVTLDDGRRVFAGSSFDTGPAQ